MSRRYAHISHLHFRKPWLTCHWQTTPAHSWWSPVFEPHPGLHGKVADCILSAWLCNSQITAYILSSEHVTGCTHELSSYGCVHKIKSANIPAWLRERFIRPHPNLRHYYHLMVTGRKSLFFKDVTTGRLPKDQWVALYLCAHKQHCLDLGL